MKVEIQWDDFYNNIILRRAVSNKNGLKYLGEYIIKGKKYSEELIFDISVYNENKDELGYIDAYAKREIAKLLAKKINGK